MTSFLPLSLIAQSNEFGAEQATVAAVGLVVLLIELAILVLMIASMWKVFTKAGEPGWAAIIAAARPR